MEKESLGCLSRNVRSTECRPSPGAGVGLAVLCREKPLQVTSESLGFSQVKSSSELTGQHHHNKQGTPQSPKDGQIQNTAQTHI